IEPHSLYPGFPFFEKDSARRKANLENNKRVLEIAALLGAKTILFHPGQLSETVPYDDCWKYALEGLHALRNRAEATHVKLGLENVWNRFLMSPIEFDIFLKAAGSSHVGIWFDIGNVVVFGYPEQWLRLLAKHVVGLHIKDFKRGPGGFFGTYEGFVPLF